MNVKYKQYYPSTFKIRTQSIHTPLIIEPTIFSTEDINLVNGHGFGFGDDIYLKSIGEYYERYISFNAVTASVKDKINNTNLSKEEKNSLFFALSQTYGNDFKHSIELEEFNLTEVTRLVDSTKTLYPSVLFSLSNPINKNDYSFVPVRDSSGSAIHSSKSIAYSKALLEFVERQCMVAMWVSKRYNKLDDIKEKSKNKKIMQIEDSLSKKGIINLYDISFLHGVNVKFIEFFDDNIDSMVNFSCGCSADFDENIAIEKSFIEMWQSSLLLLQLMFFNKKEFGGETLKKNFSASNRPNFNLNISKNPIKIGEKSEQYNIDKLTESILSVSNNVYVYLREFNIRGTVLYFYRIVSPDFFIHMNPNENNNNDNKWINIFCSQSTQRLEPLPFS